MVLDGVLADRTLTWLGSEQDKRRYFVRRVGDRVEPDEYPRLVFGKAPNTTIRYFPDKLPIGIEPHGWLAACLPLPGDQPDADGLSPLPTSPRRAVARGQPAGRSAFCFRGSSRR